MLEENVTTVTMGKETVFVKWVGVVRHAMSVPQHSKELFATHVKEDGLVKPVIGATRAILAQIAMSVPKVGYQRLMS